MENTILIVDDEVSIRMALSGLFASESFNVITATDGLEAIDILENKSVDIVISDLKMPRMDGETLLRKILIRWPAIPVIILTGNGSISNAVEAMRIGAYEFLEKPINFEHLLEVVKKAINISDLKRRNIELEEAVADRQEQDVFYNMIGRSRAMQKVFTLIQKVAKTPVDLLILGETGVGKELVAEAVHKLSKRKDYPFVPVNCSSFSDSLIQSELFGHEKGAFTGADSTREGRFELANKGTLFLDEIGELKEDTQIQLLRVLQERKLQRVGGNEFIEFDTRLITATHRDLNQRIEEGAMRQDFFYRINAFQIVVPPLRERKEDIPLLANYFLAQFIQESEIENLVLSEKAMRALYDYNWPGNIRELQSVVEHAAVNGSDSGKIDKNDLPSYIIKSEQDSEVVISLDLPFAELEKQIIMAKVSQCKGNVSKVAKEFELSERNLHRKIKEYGGKELDKQRVSKKESLL